MRTKAFSVRNCKELLRDPLSYMFCLGFPIIMLILMSIINTSIPKQAHMELFQIRNLGPGIAVFGLTFTMLFTCLSVSKDRANAFLIRLYASPMEGKDFIAGYTVPFMMIALAQCLITFAAAAIIGFTNHYRFQPSSVLIAVLILIPCMILFIGFGILFGTLFNEKAAPGLCSIIISIAGMLGGIWMDVDALGGVIAKVCKALPFYHAVKAARMAVSGNYNKMIEPFIIVTAYAVVVYILAVIVFRKKMQDDMK